MIRSTLRLRSPTHIPKAAELRPCTPRIAYDLAILRNDCAATAPDHRFRRRALRVPVALVSLVETKRQTFLARTGLESLVETSRETSFCPHAMLDDDVMVVPDARPTTRVSSDNPLVTGRSRHPLLRRCPAGARRRRPRAARSA